MAKWLMLMIGLFAMASAHAECQKDRVKLQVLGSGGPELSDGRASTAYLLWLDDKAVAILDVGSGSALNYEKSGAQPNDLRFVLFSHLHVDHSADFPAFIKAFYFSRRDHDLLVYGPEGNRLMPAVSQFVEGMLGPQGVYRYLAEYLDTAQPSRYKIRSHDIFVGEKGVQQIYRDDRLRLSAVSVHHGPLPALAWRVDVAGCSLSFSGDMNNRYDTLRRLAAHSDILIAHNAIPENIVGIGRQLHMTPTEIGKVAAQAKVKQLVLSHRMRRTLGEAVQTQTLDMIRESYSGPVAFADDMEVVFGSN